MIINHVYDPVLILVLMEDTLRGGAVIDILQEDVGLNPCFNGRYSQRTSKATRVWKILVLILVLMEDTLRGLRTFLQNVLMCLNPCFNGRYSQSKG